MNTASSWSEPNVFAPFFARRPTTRKGRPLIRTRLSTGLSPGKRLSATVCPTRQTWAATFTSWSVKSWPSTTFQSRTRKKSGLHPCTVEGAQFMSWYTTCARVRTTTATPSADGASRSMAAASWGVSVCWVPAPNMTAPEEDDPGSTMSWFWPMLEICCWTDWVAPWPMATIAMTAATPMITPSIVSAERTRFRMRARIAMRSAMNLTAWAPFPTPDGR